jgi:FkbM family methyltransferase
MKISWLSNAPWSMTGYGVQTRLFTPLIKALGHEVQISAFYGLEGGILNLGGIPIYPRGYHMYGQDIYSANANHFGADLLISLMDAWVFEPDKNINKIPWAPWFPIDSAPLPPAVKDKVELAFKRIVFSRFGERMMQEAGLDCYYVPHGVDTKVYQPGDMAKAREKLKLPMDKFVVGMVAANKGNPSRKAFCPQIEAFAMLHKQHEDTILYLHTCKGENGEHGGVNLSEFIRFHGLEIGKDVFFCDQYMQVLGYPDEAMAEYYQSFDVFMLVSMGEGFGIPIIEAQACGCPVIVGDWTSMGELAFGGWKIPIEAAEPWWTPLRAYQFMPRVGAIYEALIAAYNMKGNQRYRKWAREGVVAYNAEKVAREYWKPVLEDIEANLPEKSTPEGHKHHWIKVGLYNADGSLSVPCRDCGAELIKKKDGSTQIIEGGFKNELGLKFSQPDGLEWLLLREVERDYQLDDLNLGPESLVVDIGAHVGVVSMYLAKKTGCKVYAYEPEPGNFRRLVENIKANEFGKQIIAHNVAITRDARAVLIGGGNGNSGGHTIYVENGEMVGSYTLRDTFGGKIIDLLKIDCEGAEFEIFEDLSILEGRVKAIRGELHRGRCDAEALLAALKAVIPDTKMTIQGGGQ